jgi:hypothetical protein
MASPVNCCHQLGQPVVHDEVGIAQLAGGAEIEDVRRHAAIEHDG